jgi:phosphoribosyl 1,2-cyclic phosphodiesterase
MAMRLKLHGVRGSRPTHKRSLLGYGGNSTAFELVFDKSDFHLFVDGGSGLVPRGHELGIRPDKNRFHFLVTHTHWDHILGLPFFEPIYGKDNDFVFYASTTTRSSFHELFFGLHRRGNLPVPRASMQANLDFKVVAPGDRFTIERKVKVETFQLNHNGVTLGYKITCGASSCAIITDNAPIHDGNHLGEGMREAARGDPAAFERRFEAGLVAFMRGAHTVVFDTHFTEKQLKPDWGHSTPQRALAFCKAAGVKRLVLFHHAPEDSDELVDDKVQSIFHEACHAGIELEAAREGDEWDLCA